MKYLIFDMDGTLIDSGEGVLASLANAIESYNISYDKKRLPEMIGPPFGVGLKNIFNIDVNKYPGIIARYRDTYRATGWNKYKVYDGIIDVIKELKKRGYKTILGTSKPIEFAEKILKQMDCLKYFDFIGAAASDTERATKEEVLEWVIKECGISNEKDQAIMIGDRMYDILGARAVGIETIGVLWGYGGKEELKKYGAKQIIKSPKDLLEIFPCLHPNSVNDII